MKLNLVKRDRKTLRSPAHALSTPELKGFGRPNKEPKNLPFPEDDDSHLFQKTKVAQPQPANNQHLIDKEQELDNTLSHKLRPAVQKLQDFYLDDAATMLLSLDISTDESVAVLERVLQSSVNMSGVRKMLETALHEALSIKALRCASEVSNLDPQEDLMLKAIYILKATGGSPQGTDEKILSELLKILTVPRPEERPAPRVRQARPTQGDARHPRVDRDSAPARKGKKG